MSLIVADHVFEGRGGAVMEIRRARRESAQRRRLEAAEIIPKPGNLATSRIGQLANLARCFVAESVKRQVGRARLSRGYANVEEQIVDVRAVVHRIMATVACASAEAGFSVEQLLSASDLPAARV